MHVCTHELWTASSSSDDQLLLNYCRLSEHGRLPVCDAVGRMDLYDLYHIYLSSCWYS